MGKRFLNDKLVNFLMIILLIKWYIIDYDYYFLLIIFNIYLVNRLKFFSFFGINHDFKCWAWKNSRKIWQWHLNWPIFCYWFIWNNRKTKFWWKSNNDNNFTKPKIQNFQGLNKKTNPSLRFQPTPGGCLSPYLNWLIITSLKSDPEFKTHKSLS